MEDVDPVIKLIALGLLYVVIRQASHAYAVRPCMRRHLVLVLFNIKLACRWGAQDNILQVGILFGVTMLQGATNHPVYSNRLVSRSRPHDISFRALLAGT